MRNNFQSNVNGQMLGGGSIEHPLSIHSASIGTRWKPRGMQVLMTLVFLFTLGLGQMWGADPDLSVTFDGDTYSNYVKDYTAKGIKLTFYANGNDANVEQTAFKGNLSGHYYEDIAKSSTAYNHGSLLIEASSVIDSISLFWVPNNTSKNTFLGVVGWNARATTSASYSNIVDTLFTTTAYNISTKNYDAAKWETLDLSNSSLKALAFSRKFPKNVFTYNESLYSSNFGGEQTVLILGVKVWLHPTVTKYTITYAKGEYGTGDAIANGEKTKDVAFTLSSSTYTRENYTQQGWSTTDGGAKAYDLGGTYTANAAITLYPFWVSSAATQSNITYTNTKGADNSNPAKYTEGVGIASFEPLSDVDGFHFTGWNPPSIAADASGDKTIIATWVPTYNVSFDKGAGSGTAPDGFQKWTGATFELPGQGDMIAPEGKVFGGWKVGVSDKYAAGDTYTMGTTSVEFIAQWDVLVEQVLYSWESPDGTAVEVGGTAITKDKDGNTVEGNANVNATLTNVTVAYKAIMLNGKIKSNAWDGNYIQITTDEAIKTGDKVKVTACTTKGDTSKKGSAQMRAGSSATSTAIFTDGNSYNDILADGTLSPNTKTFTVPDGVNTSTLTMTRSQSSTNCWVTKLQIVREKAVPEEDLRTVTFNTNGGSSIAAVKVEKGTAVAKPADPTKAHCRFEGWQLSGSDYNFSSAVNSNITLDAVWTQLYTVTYAKGDESATGDAPTQADLAAGEKFTVAANTFAVAGKDFDTWNDGTADVAPNTEYTMGSANVVLTAQWKTALAKYTVHYMDEDGTTPLGDDELVEVGEHPAGISATKPLYTFASWQLSGSDIALSAVSAAANEEVTLTARWEKLYASTIDIEEFIDDNGTSGDWATYLSNHGYAISSTSDVSLDGGDSGNKPADKGLKIKKAGRTITFEVVADKVVVLKVGSLKGGAQIKVNEGEYADLTGASPLSTGASVFSYYYSANVATYTIKTSTDDYNIIQSITIRDPYTVSFEAHGDADPSALQGMPSVTLPDAANGTSSLLGWFDAETGGNKIGDAGETYIPTANITLHAQWEAISTDNTLSDLKVGGVTVDGFSPAVHTYYVVLPYGTKPENIPAISATANSAKAKQVAIQQAVWTGDPYNCYRAQANVQAEDESWGYYDVRFSFAPKDGISLIKVATTGGSNKTVTGLYAGDGDVSLSSGDEARKMNKYNYIGFILDGTTLQAGDKINVHTTVAANTGGSHLIFYDNMTDKNELYDTEEIGGLGDNIFTINAAMVGATRAYVYRSNADDVHKWNGYVDYIEVTRAMNPVLTAITLDGVAADKDSEFAFSAMLPNGTNLASMTIVPTIIKNGEGGSAAPTAAWAWGANTYRVEDKDGDYTDYTITLTEAAAPSAAPVITAQPVGANYLEGAAIAALEVVATGESLTYQWYLGADAIDGATEATYTPAVSAIGSYVYHCVVTNTEAGHPATSLASDNATITIAEDPAAIKLIAANGDINTTDFITAVSKGTVNYGGADHNCATFGSTASTAVGASGLNKFIIYNAKTDQTKIKFVLYNTQNSAQKLVLQKLAEGGDAMEEIEIDVPSKEEFTTEYYTYTSSANRTMYAFVKNTGIKVLQVKVIDNGTALKQFGEVGYSINFNQGRLFLNSGTDGAYDGLTYNAASNYAPLTNSGLSITKSKAYSFNVPAAATMTVTAANNAKYYITQTEDGEDNETAVAAATSFDLTAGTWYLRVAGSNLSVTSIAFAAPKCAEPSFAALANSDVCEGDGYVALNGTATVADAGVPTYQWYNADGDEAIDGATAAEFTPTADGSYYVIATNHLADHSDNAKQSATVTVTTFASAAITTAPESQRKVAGQNATLSVVASGKAPLSYQWYTCDENGDNAVAIENAEAASYVVAVTAGLHQYYKVIVTSGCGSAEAIALVEEWADYAQVDVTGSMTWNFTTANLGLEADVEATSTKVLANVGQGAIPNNANFHSDMLVAMVEATQTKVRATENGGCYQGDGIKFHTTVPGVVTVTYRGTGNSASVTLTIGTTTLEPYAGGFTTSKVVYVPAGDVEITSVGTMRIKEIVFDADPDYHRTVNPSYLGTLCWTNNAVLGGATLYEFAGKNEYNYLVFDEVEENRLEAGKPYIFMPENGNTEIKVYNTDNEPALTTDQDPVNNMYGTITGKTLVPGVDDNMYYFSSNHIWRVGDFNEDINVPAYYCYVDYEAVLADEPAPAPAPGRRRVTMGVNGKNTPTGIDAINASEQPMKLLINGQIFILRGEKMFDATGRLVK